MRLSPDTDWLVIKELAAEIRIAERTIRNWRVLGKGPRAHKIGSRVLFSRADVDSWLATLAEQDQPNAGGDS